MKAWQKVLAGTVGVVVPLGIVFRSKIANAAQVVQKRVKKTVKSLKK